MADGLLSGLLGTVLKELNSLILQEVGLAWGYKRELRKLKSTLSTIQAVLHDTEQQEIRSAALKNWLRKLKDAAYDADDFLDAYATDVLSRKLKGQSSTLNLFVHRFRIGHRIKEIRERLDGIAEERSKFHLKDAMVEEPLDTGHSHQTHSFVIESEIYGREDDKRNLLKLLMDGQDPVFHSVIPIVGMGGIGKTTVAKLVYNDKTVVDHFDLRIWVCVSERFDERGLQQAIIESVTGNKCDIYNMHTMINKLTETLLGKRFLLVLDNVWSEDLEKWDTFQLVLKCGVMGSKVIITTRSEKVAIVLGNVNPYHLEVLSDDDCWTLFQQRAFRKSREEKPNLVAIGKEIVKKCGGVPLAAKALGSMMRFKNDEKQWLSIKESEIWNLPDDDENVILPALKLSYSHLSPHLKQCFAYCSIFPKGYVIKKTTLILLWMANGFLTTKRKMTLEDVGMEIFHDLLMRSFFQSVQQTDDGRVRKCKMHDLVSDLAQYIMRNECFINQTDIENADIEMARHLCCDMRPLMPIAPSGLYRARSLRTFLLLSINARYISSRVPPDITNFKCLRVLSLRRSDIYEMPISIENLKHLRYLDLSFTHISTLPESLDSLQNLQTLLLEYCKRLYKLPKRLRNIINLRHINIKGCTSLTQMPPQIGRLTQLQTLSNYIVGEKEGSPIGELQSLNLRGKLHIKELQNVLNGMDAREANLISKQDIQSLGLSWKEDGRAKSVKDHEEVLEALQPYINLKRFYLENYMGLEIPSWMRSPFISKLVEISLVKCRNIKKLPQLGKLPCLKILFIEGIDSLQYIDSEFFGDDTSRGIPFPSLEKFTLIKLPNLDGWENLEIREQFPCLSKLIIRKCFKLRNLPCILSLRHLVLEYCNEMLLMSLERQFASLSSLHISGFPDMESLPSGMLENLHHLQSFKIEDCPRVKHLSTELKPLLDSNKGVSIWKCDDLTSISEDTRLEHDSTIRSSSPSYIHYVPVRRYFDFDEHWS